MQARVLDANQPGAIEEAAQLIKAGRLVAFPTDTLYGVGANVHDPLAIELLYQAKGRSLKKGIPILLSDANGLLMIVKEITPLAHFLIEHYWPGPLTLVLPKQPDLPAGLSPDDNIAVRIPDSEVARKVIRAAGGAVATSSANRSGQAPALNAQEALAALGDRVAAVLDGGPVVHGAASTIVDCSTTPPRVLREGPLSTDKFLQEMVSLR